MKIAKREDVHCILESLDFDRAAQRKQNLEWNVKTAASTMIDFLERSKPVKWRFGIWPIYNSWKKNIFFITRFVNLSKQHTTERAQNWMFKNLVRTSQDSDRTVAVKASETWRTADGRPNTCPMLTTPTQRDVLVKIDFELRSIELSEEESQWFLKCVEKPTSPSLIQYMRACEGSSGNLPSWVKNTWPRGNFCNLKHIDSNSKPAPDCFARPGIHFFKNSSRSILVRCMATFRQIWKSSGSKTRNSHGPAHTHKKNPNHCLNQNRLSKHVLLFEETCIYSISLGLERGQ